jgi:hypothetical protein
MPQDVAQSSWECAYELWNTYHDRLSEDERQQMLHASFCDPEDISAELCADIAVLWGRVVEQRV